MTTQLQQIIIIIIIIIIITIIIIRYYNYETLKRKDKCMSYYDISSFTVKYRNFKGTPYS